MLSDMALRRLKPREKPYKVSDGDGLYVLVSPSGSVLWRLNYRQDGRQKTKAFGAYPDVSLRDARRMKDDFRDAGSNDVQFGKLIDGYMAKRRAEEIAPATRKKLELHVGYLRDALGEIVDPSPADFLRIMRSYEARGYHHTATRLRSVAGRICRYGVAEGLLDSDPTRDLRDALIRRAPRHRSALFDRKSIGGLLRAVNGYDRPVVRLGLRLLMLTMLRPGELRCGRWSEIESGVWRIPASRVKMRREHLVPLSRQALAALDELRVATAGDLMFPGMRSINRPISDNTLNAALRSLGYSGDVVVAHGFRRTASTLLNEAGWNRDWIERQLGHVDGGVRGVYNAAEYLEGRREMLQAWADMVDELCSKF